jgi:hypothetical protein
MRDNGLPARDWVHVADVDPRVAAAALDALRDAGVAAYTTPHAGRAGPYLDVQLPSRPTDRLYVESGARERAVIVLTALERASRRPDDRPEPHRAHSPDDPDVDTTFAEIVARLELDSATRPGSTPDGSASTEPPRAGRDTPPQQPPGRVLRDIGWDDLLADDQSGESDGPDSQDLEDGYIPPPPPPVPRGTPLRRFAWAAVLGAPLVVVACVLVDYRLDGWTGLLVVGAFIGGLTTLFATLGDRPTDEDEPDHGAVV